MGMTIKEKDYAMRRVNSIFYEKKAVIAQKHYTAAVELSIDKKWIMVKQGKAKIHPKYSKIRPTRHELWADIFDWSKHEKAAMHNEVAIEKELEPIRRKSTAIEDTIMLGDSDKALKMIQEFEK